MTNDSLLRFALKLDGVASGGLGLLALAGAGALDGPLGIRSAALAAFGAFLLVYGLGVYLIGTRRRISPALVWTVIAGNLVWTVLSLAAATADPLTGLGAALVVAQAVAVVGFAGLQVAGVRRA